MRRSHCRRGHKFTPTNIYIRPNGQRRCAKCRNAYERQYRASHERPNRTRPQRLNDAFRRKGVTMEWFNKLKRRQRGRCLICGGLPVRGARLCIDHNRRCCNGEQSCGECVRGLLCHLCNRALGFFKDSAALLRKAASYLEKYEYIEDD